MSKPAPVTRHVYPIPLATRKTGRPHVYGMHWSIRHTTQSAKSKHRRKKIYRRLTRSPKFYPFPARAETCTMNLKGHRTIDTAKLLYLLWNSPVKWQKYGLRTATTRNTVWKRNVAVDRPYSRRPTTKSNRRRAMLAGTHLKRNIAPFKNMPKSRYATRRKSINGEHTYRAKRPQSGILDKQ